MTKSEEYINETIHIYTDSINIFEKRLLADEITCINPYFDRFFDPTEYHKIMAQHGLYIDKLIETGDKYVIADLVRYNHAQEYYKDWAKNGEDEVQKALLEKGLYVDILNQSNNADVRYAVAKRYPDLSLAYLKSLKDNKHYRSLDLLMSQTKPNIKALKFLFSLNWHKTGYNLQILKSKYKVMHKIPTAIEKTMTPFQLYQTRNPLWKINLSGYNISCVKYGQKKFDNKNLTLTEKDFEILSYCTDTYTVDCHIEWRLANRKD